MLEVLKADEVEELRPELLSSFHSSNPVINELRRIQKGEAVKVNKAAWGHKFKSAPAVGNLKPKKFERYTTADGIYWLYVRVT